MTGRFSWALALAVLIVSGALMGLIGSDDSGEQSPVPVPTSAESTQADAVRARLPGGDQVPVIVVFSRNDGQPLTTADLGAIKQQPVMVSEDGKAAVATVPLDTGLSGFALRDVVKELRDSARDGLPDDLRVEVTGGPAFGADIADSFSGANITLLAVTALVVALLLIATYRSPVLWLVPLGVIGVGRSRRCRCRHCGRAIRRDDAGRLDRRHHQRAGIRRRHQLRPFVDLALPRRAGPHRKPPRCASGSCPPGRPCHPCQQCHRRAGAADPGARLVAQHQEPRRASRRGSRRGRGVRAARAATHAGPVRARAVLAVRPEARRETPYRGRCLAPYRRRGGTQAGPRHRRRRRRPWRCSASESWPHRSAFRRPNSSGCRRSPSADTTHSRPTFPAG